MQPDSDGEFEGTRELVFEGELVDGSTDEGGSIRGLLVGNFDVDPERSVEAPAAVETYSRGDAVGLIQLTVRDDDGRVTLQISLEPTDDGDYSGVGFLGHQSRRSASS